ncbi:MAG: hypothetical protein ABW154_00125 [Dyella sp.]
MNKSNAYFLIRFGKRSPSAQRVKPVRQATQRNECHAIMKQQALRDTIGAQSQLIVDNTKESAPTCSLARLPRSSIRMPQTNHKVTHRALLMIFKKIIEY